jgi:uncharacterized membrane protein
MSFVNFIGTWINENPGKTNGCCAGLALGILIFTIGFLKTLLIIILVLVGYIVGKARDDNMSIVDEITGLFKRKKKDEEV